MPSKTVAVIVPTYHRKEKLIRCVSSFLKQTYENFQVVVIDDASPNPVTLSWFVNQEKVVVLRNESNRKQAASRNRGIRWAGAEICILIDDDCYVEDERWIEKHVNLNKRFPNHLVGGRITNVTRTLWAKARASLTRNGIQYGNFLQTMNLSFSMATYEKLGGFNESFGELEDVDFSQRGKKEGIGLIYDDSIEIFHEFDDEFSKILRRNFQYGRWTVPVRKSQRLDGHWILPGGFVSSLIYYLPLCLLSTAAQVLLALRERPMTLFFSPLIFCYTLAHTAGMVSYYWKERSKHNS